MIHPERREKIMYAETVMRHNSCPESNYTVSLLKDYSRYIKDFGIPVTINDFIKGWNIIPWYEFNSITTRDIVYTIYDTPQDWEAIEKPRRRDDNSLVLMAMYHGDRLDALEEGTVYYKPYIHDDYETGESRYKDKYCKHKYKTTIMNIKAVDK